MPAVPWCASGLHGEEQPPRHLHPSLASPAIACRHPGSLHKRSGGRLPRPAAVSHHASAAGIGAPACRPTGGHTASNSPPGRRRIRPWSSRRTRAAWTAPTPLPGILARHASSPVARPRRHAISRSSSDPGPSALHSDPSRATSTSPTASTGRAPSRIREFGSTEPGCRGSRGTARTSRPWSRA